MTANATGAFTKLAIKEETTIGTAATGNFVLVPAKSITLSPTQPFLEDPLIGQGREQLRQPRDVKNLQGSIVVPIDVRAIGYWLKSMLGAPTTTGSADPYTHVFKSSTAALKSFTAEQQFANIATPAYSLTPGVMVNTMAFDVTPQGVADATLGLLYFDAADSTSTGAGTPTTVELDRFFQFDGQIKKDASALGAVTSASFNYSNNLDPVRYVGGAGAIGDMDIGIAALTGRIVTRFKDLSLFTIADAASLFDLQLTFYKSASRSLTFEFEQCEMTRDGREISGPAGIQCNFALSGSKDVAEGQMLTVTLVNDMASY